MAAARGAQTQYLCQDQEQGNVTARFNLISILASPCEGLKHVGNLHNEITWSWGESQESLSNADLRVFFLYLQFKWAAGQQFGNIIVFNTKRSKQKKRPSEELKTGLIYGNAPRSLNNVYFQGESQIYSITLKFQIVAH